MKSLSFLRGGRGRYNCIVNFRVKNQEHYDRYWRHYKIRPPETWSQWFLIKKFTGKTCLEIGPGTKPKIPIRGNYFLDVSIEAVNRLNELGGKAVWSDLSDGIPFEDRKFDLVCAFEVLEHIPNDERIISEIGRVLRKDGVALVSFPLNMKFWNRYDEVVGHVRRYEPKQLTGFFEQGGFKIVQYSELDISWPDKLSGLILTHLTNRFGQVLTKLQEFIDMMPNSGVREKIGLKKWNKDSATELSNATTGFFVLKKKISMTY